MARNKYLLFASIAKKEGYEQIAEIFEETANNERAHSKMWLNKLGAIGNTMDNLMSCQDGEYCEWAEMYPRMAKEAKEEGFPEIAAEFEAVAQIEREHELRYAKLIANMSNGEVFRKEQEEVWICRNCGYIHTGKEAPAVCPVCAHPRAFFELRAYNY